MSTPSLQIHSLFDPSNSRWRLKPNLPNPKTHKKQKHCISGSISGIMSDIINGMLGGSISDIISGF